ncbi:MAG: hypothetical protein LBS00_06610 [Synergistaceae bacterium]|nr:hypothetical protein [Synergistaceae bacterium]
MLRNTVSLPRSAREKIKKASFPRNFLRGACRGNAPSLGPLSGAGRGADEESAIKICREGFE